MKGKVETNNKTGKWILQRQFVLQQRELPNVFKYLPAEISRDMCTYGCRNEWSLTDQLQRIDDLHCFAMQAQQQKPEEKEDVRQWRSLCTNLCNVGYAAEIIVVPPHGSLHRAITDPLRFVDCQPRSQLCGQKTMPQCEPFLFRLNTHLHCHIVFCRIRKFSPSTEHVALLLSLRFHCCHFLSILIVVTSTLLCTQIYVVVCKFYISKFFFCEF